ncbi:ParB/Srx family N-terminal domain-containing protein [Sporomusa sp. KB1]|jgi:ParB-like chromosome segregation protein Spo0J|uniref:ParB/Srx family N-terminal domain-containing protein n=1 Tax=Sporomusa sp. KB1 TaxID=943346 RepID=UPI0011A7039B|nr:ParB/Srx family N-terminal domain-containing protein [Sporomusa sp. KB1]
MTTENIFIHCAYDELVDITILVPNPRNPNQHPQKQIELLAKMIKNQGWRAPITVSNRSGFVVRGHGRLLAAQLLGVGRVPVDRQDYATEAEEWADLIADNRIAELSAIDPTMLTELLEELNVGAIDMDLTGFDESELDKLMTRFSIPDKEFPEYDESVEKSVKKVVCPHCGEEFPV